MQTQPAIELPGWARVLHAIGHPALAVVWAIPIARYFGRYTPQEVTELQRVPLFLQGSTDWGGACLFSATIALYAALGFLACFYFTAELVRRPTVRGALWSLRFHALLFLIGGTANLWYDTRIGPNDFRNMGLWAGSLYVLSTVWIIGLSRTRLSLAWRMALAPALIAGWLWLGADGNTTKAGQIVYAGQDPVHEARSVRHAIMLSWHALCDRTLGNEPNAWLRHLPLWAGLLLVLALLAATARFCERKGWCPASHCWGGFVLFIALAYTVTASRNIIHVRSAMRTLDPVHEQILHATSANLIRTIQADPAWFAHTGNLVKADALSAETRAFVMLLKDTVDAADHPVAIRLLIPLDEAQYAFLWANPAFAYADRRRLHRGPTRLTDLHVVDHVLAGGHHYGRGWPAHLDFAGLSRKKVLLGSPITHDDTHAVLLTGEW